MDLLYYPTGKCTRHSFESISYAGLQQQNSHKIVPAPRILDFDPFALTLQRHVILCIGVNSPLSG